MSEKLSNTEVVLLDKVNQLIDDNLGNESFSSDTICKEFGLSRSQLFRLIKESSDLSISLYIRQRKLQKARDLLVNSELKISEITYAVGIDSPQSFSKYFTESYGVSPTEYRKNKDKMTVQYNSQDIYNKVLVESHVSTKTFNKNWLWGIPILLVLFSSIYFFQKNNAIDNQTTTDNSIAILPFKNIGNIDNAFFADGLVEQVHSSLTLLKKLRVISKNSSSQFKDSQKTIPQIASELQVAYILDGTIKQAGSKILVSIELVKAREDKTIWIKSFEAETNDVIGITNKITKEIIEVLREQLSDIDTQQSNKIQTENTEAYNEYLQGRQLLATRTKEKMIASLEKMDKAIALDPSFADAYASKAGVYFSLGNLNYINLDSSFRMAEQEALEAIRIDVANAEAYGLLAAIYRDQHKWEQANTTFQIALRCNPNNAQVNYWYSLMLRSLGMLDEALAYSTKALLLDPLSPVILGGHIRNCSYAKRIDLVNEAIKKGKLLFNDSYLFYWSTGYHYLDIKDYPKAFSDLTKAKQLNPTVKGIEAAIAYTQACMGQDVAAKNYLTTLANIPDNYTYFAMVYAGLKDKENSFKYLEQMAALKQIPTDIKVSPFFKSLKGDKRFDELLKRFGLHDVKVEVE
ncbi:helix-turn-helix domain-containing protein [Emticicia sp. W12TSBA100-4]|uniref:helix-turn-helix domain-containing protein n=1 Tax=Emticicia sp. W12TSBA100-4 TaxID=3160965 RepID=UPI003305B7B4